MSVIQPFEEAPAFPSALVVGANTSNDIDTTGCAHLNFFANLTTTNSGSVIFTIQGKDSVSGSYYTILAGASMSTVTTQRLRVSPNLTGSANSIAQDIMPRFIRILATISTAVPVFTVGVDLTD